MAGQNKTREELVSNDTRISLAVLDLHVGD